MRKPEQKLWDSMSAARPHDLWLQRIENGVGDGIPDVFAKYDDKTNSNFWVELKSARMPKRKSTIIFKQKGLRPSQRNWHRKYHLAGGKSFILARLDLLGEQTLWLIEGRWCDDINSWDFFELSTRALKPKTWPDIFEYWRAH